MVKSSKRKSRRKILREEQEKRLKEQQEKTLCARCCLWLADDNFFLQDIVAINPGSPKKFNRFESPTEEHEFQPTFPLAEEDCKPKKKRRKKKKPMHFVQMSEHSSGEKEVHVYITKYSSVIEEKRKNFNDRKQIEPSSLLENIRNARKQLKKKRLEERNDITQEDGEIHYEAEKKIICSDMEKISEETIELIKSDLGSVLNVFVEQPDFPLDYHPDLGGINIDRMVNLSYAD